MLIAAFILILFIKKNSLPKLYKFCWLTLKLMFYSEYGFFNMYL